MDKEGKVQEEVPKNLNVLIRDKLKILEKEFGDLCSTLEKLGVSYKSYCETSDSNAVLKADETTDVKNKVTKKATTCSTSKISKTIGVSTIDYGVLSSNSDSNETEICFDKGSDASTSNTDTDELSDSGSDTSSTAIHSSNSDPDASSSSSENSESDSELSTTTMESPTKDRTEFCVVENYSVGDSMECFSKMFTNTVKFEDRNTEVNGTFVTYDEALDSVQLEMLTSKDAEETFNGFLSYNNLNTQTGDQEPCTDNSNNSRHDTPDINQETTIMAEEYSHIDPQLVNDEIISVKADENKRTDTDEDWKFMMFFENFLKDAKKAFDHLSDSNQKKSEYLKSSDGNTESCHSALKFSDSDVKLCLSGLKTSDRNRENALNLLELRNSLISSIDSSDLGRRATTSPEKSFQSNSDSIKRRRTSVSSDETMVEKKVTVNLTGSDNDDWNSLSFATTLEKEANKSIAEFLSSRNQNQNETSGISGNDSENCDGKLSLSYEKSHIDRRARNLSDVPNDIIKRKLFPSDNSEDMHSMPFQNSPIAKDCPRGLYDNPALHGNERRPVSSKATKRPLNNIFRTFIKCYPPRKCEIPPYASTNAEITLAIAERKLYGSRTNHTKNDMPLSCIDKTRIPKESFPSVDSHSVVYFESVNCFSHNCSIACDALIKEYLNIAIQINVFLIKKVEDVKTEDYLSRMRILNRLDDLLGYLSGRLITTRNEWVRQYIEIKQTLTENASIDLYRVGILRVCTALTAILLNLCFEKQLELEDYEQNMIFHHECSD